MTRLLSRLFPKPMYRVRHHFHPDLFVWNVDSEYPLGMTHADAGKNGLDSLGPFPTAIIRFCGVRAPMEKEDAVWLAKASGGYIEKCGRSTRRWHEASACQGDD